MNKKLTVKYLEMEKNQTTDEVVKEQFNKIKDEYDLIESCNVSIAHFDRYFSKSGDCYRVDINLRLTPEQNFFVVREPDYANQTESAEFVVVDAFNLLQKQLQETLN